MHIQTDQPMEVCQQELKDALDSRKIFKAERYTGWVKGRFFSMAYTHDKEAAERGRWSYNKAMGFLTEKEAVRIEQAFQSLTPVHPGITLTVTGGRSMPPMEDASENRSLLEVAKQAAEALDYPLQTCSAGGCSDGNLTSAAGIPTLDGLGATGEGLHARHEQLYVEEYPLRTALMASLLMRLHDFGC